MQVFHHDLALRLSPVRLAPSLPSADCELEAPGTDLSRMLQLRCPLVGEIYSGYCDRGDHQKDQKNPPIMGKRNRGIPVVKDHTTVLAQKRLPWLRV